MGRRSNAGLIPGLAVALVVSVGILALAPVFTCGLCADYAPLEDGCSACGGDGRSSLHKNWRFRSWERGTWLTSPF